MNVSDGLWGELELGIELKVSINFPLSDFPFRVIDVQKEQNIRMQRDDEIPSE